MRPSESRALSTVWSKTQDSRPSGSRIAESGRDLATITGHLPVYPHQQHGPVGGEASARAEALDPPGVVEPAVEMNVDAAVAERHGMDAVGGAGTGSQGKTAVEQRVVGLEPVLRPTRRVAGAVHPRRRLLAP